MAKQTFGLRAKILGCVFVTVFLSFAVTVWMITEKIHSVATLLCKQIAERSVQEAALLVTNQLNGAMGIAKDISISIDVVGSNDKPARHLANKLLERLLADNKGILATYTGWEKNAFDGLDLTYAGTKGHDSTGRFVPYWNRAGGAITVEPLVGYEDPVQGDYYLNAKKIKRPHVTDPYKYLAGGRELFVSSFIWPLLRNGQFVGMAGIDLAMDTVQQELSKIRPLGLGYVSLYTGNGSVVYSPRIDEIGKVSKVAEYFKGATALGKAIEWVNEKGDINLMAPISLEGTDQYWAVVVTLPYSSIFASANDVKFLAMLFAVGCLAVTLFVIYCLVTWLTKPLSEISNSMADLATGGGDLTFRIKSKRKDEIGEASNSLDEFMSALQQMFVLIRSSSINLIRGLGNITHSTQAISESSSRLLEISSQNAASIQQLSVSIDHIADHAREADSAIEETKSLVTIGASSVSAMEEQMGNIRTTIDALAESLRSLSGGAEQVAGVTNVIRGIADQTNLLALNAAIEAARAGEHGRGFAVVADEVRVLAERTSIATEEIRQTLEQIRKGSEHTARGMESTQQAVRLGTEGANEVASIMQGVLSSISVATYRVHEIAEATREQSTATEELARAAERASDIVQSTDESIQMANNAVIDLHSSAKGVAELIGKFKI